MCGAETSIRSDSNETKQISPHFEKHAASEKRVFEAIGEINDRVRRDAWNLDLPLTPAKALKKYERRILRKHRIQHFTQQQKEHIKNLFKNNRKNATNSQ